MCHKNGHKNAILLIEDNYKSKLINYLSYRFQRAQETHERAREVIERYDETHKAAKAISQKTRDLLSRNGH